MVVQVMSCQRDLRDAMDDEAFMDITLVGTDNAEVPCTKFVLATRSPIFKKMFFGGFQEQQSDRAYLDYPSVILKILVKYCYSDEVDLDFILEAECLTDQEAISLVQLRDAARYFELNDVANHIEREIGEAVFQNKETGCVCAILSELMNRIDDEGPFWDMFLQLVIHKPEECLIPNGPSETNQGAMVCHPRLLSKLLDKVADKYVVVRCLQKWFEDGCMEEESNADLLQVSKNIDLKELSPCQLSSIKPSPLFPMARIYEAFVHHGARTKAPQSQGTNSVIYVSGSGVKAVNGYYYNVSSIFPSTFHLYQKEGMYGEMKCHFEVKLSSEDCKWTISAIPKGYNSVPLHMYEASSTEGAQPPFKFWKCVEGTEPAPLVAMIDTTSPLPKSASPSRPPLVGKARTPLLFGSISQPIQVSLAGSPAKQGGARRVIRGRRPS